MLAIAPPVSRYADTDVLVPRAGHPNVFGSQARDGPMGRAFPQAVMQLRVLLVVAAIVFVVTVLTVRRLLGR